ncbi:hypothetical protein DSO57_1034486 [Entomophthora muscae]|uniref:Uncharacterized protein n=1 Tax=Entomophthora muscae TaxID=34485 RepID=A0ACC2SCG0_9FUNG|nr:hypothetical protein DSO57_1034486 [Entomophthora muscae]
MTVVRNVVDLAKKSKIPLHDTIALKRYTLLMSPLLEATGVVKILNSKKEPYLLYCPLGASPFLDST